MKSYNSRKEVPEKYKWDLSNFVKDEKDYQAKINFVKENLKKLKDFVGCTKDSKKLREYMEFDIELGGCLERLDAYTYLLQDEDLANDEAKEKRLNVLNLLTEYVYESSFFTPELIGYEEIPASMLRDGNNYFSLKIDGDSMYPDYKTGDIIIIRQQSDCNSGDDCVVMVNGDDATFKRVVKQEKSIILKPLNNEYEPYYFDEYEIMTKPVKIIGVAVEVRRKLR